MLRALATGLAAALLLAACGAAGAPGQPNGPAQIRATPAVQRTTLPERAGQGSRLRVLSASRSVAHRIIEGGPLAQWIEQRISTPQTWVRLLHGLLDRWLTYLAE